MIEDAWPEWHPYYLARGRGHWRLEPAMPFGFAQPPQHDEPYEL